MTLERKEGGPGAASGRETAGRGSAERTKERGSGTIPPHALHFMSSRQCPYLACGKGSMRTVLELLPAEEKAALQSFRITLRAARRVAEACRALGGWLIEPELLSFDPAEIYFTRDGRRACLQLGGMGLGLYDGMLYFLDRLDELSAASGAGRIAERLRDLEPAGHAGTSVPGCEDILRELSLWELELD